MEKLSRRQLLQVAGGFLLERLLPEPQPLYFEETGHNLKGEFLDYWRRRRNGLFLGRPISDELRVDGRQVQYFENARLELHPENWGTRYEVQLGLLGEELVPRELRSPGEKLFNPEFFDKYGGIDFFGYVISKPRRDGDKTYQYTQRFLVVEQDEVEAPQHLIPSYRLYKENRERHPRLLWPGKISIVPLGRVVAQRKGIDATSHRPDPQSVIYTPDLFDKEKRIEVSIAEQTITAYEGETPVMETSVSTGASGFDTPVGSYSILNKIPVMDYRSPFPLRRVYFQPSVPWNMQFFSDYLIHGAYWHDQFGTRRSAGCVNLNLDDASWLYDWARVGTPVVISR